MVNVGGAGTPSFYLYFGSSLINEYIKEVDNITSSSDDSGHSDISS